MNIECPAPFLATRSLYERRGAALKPWRGQAAALQLAQAATYGFSADGRLLAALGFWRLPDGGEEVFTVSEPADLVAPHLREIMRAARLIVAARLQSGVVRMVATVGIGPSPGARMARLAGFSPSPLAAPKGFAVWELPA